jgi:hypothetical protein
MIPPMIMRAVSTLTPVGLRGWVSSFGSRTRG